MSKFLRSSYGINSSKSIYSSCISCSVSSLSKNSSNGIPCALEAAGGIEGFTATAAVIVGTARTGISALAGVSVSAICVGTTVEGVTALEAASGT